MWFSVSCLAAIAVVVVTYDGKRIPQFVSGLSLNTVISVLSTAARFGLVFVVGVSIGQSKWCWFNRSGRRLHDVQAMDDASRGPMGAFSIIPSRVRGGLATMGALITLVMIAFSPFLQQLVEYPPHFTIQPDSIALAPQTLTYSDFSMNDMYSSVSYPNVNSVIEAGIWSAQKAFDQEPTCPTGRCSWSSFKSVGWCSKCEDRTSLANLGNCTLDTLLQNKTDLSKVCMLDLGNGVKAPFISGLPSVELNDGKTRGRFRFNYTSESIWPVNYGGLGLLGLLDVESSNASYQNDTDYIGIRNPLIVLWHLAVEYVQHSGAPNALALDLFRVMEASLCVLTLCEKTLSLDRTDGTTTWTDESTAYGNVFTNGVSVTRFGESREEKALCWQAGDGDVDLIAVGNETSFVDRSGRAFCPVERYSDSLQQLMRQEKVNAEFFMAKTVEGLYALAVAVSPLTPTNSYTVGQSSTRTMSDRVESIAHALTNYGLRNTNDTVRGRAFTEVTFVRVRWRWIILPILLELASIVLLVCTIVHSQSEGGPIWKSSVLALIYHGVNELHGEATHGIQCLSDMEITAKAMDVQLFRSEDGLNSVLKRKGHHTTAQEE